MTNFDTARSALETSLGSSGSALVEHSKYMDSIEAKISQLKASWQSFAQTFMSSSTLKGGIEFLKVLLGLLEGIIDNFGIIGTISLGVVGKSIFSYFKGAEAAEKTINDVVDAINNIPQAMANATSAATETAESMANVGSASTEVAETSANVASSMTETAESMANVGSAATETAESMANVGSASTEATEAVANLASGGSEVVETIGNVASTATDGAEAMGNIAVAATEAGETAVKSAGGFKAFATSTAGIVTGVGLAVAAIALWVNAYQNFKQEQARLRQETIETSDKFLDAAASFEQAYIKYSGKTELTEAEEADLTSAINGTVEALGSKSGALQDVVSSSNDYLASLEAIADAELKTAQNAANKKLIAVTEEIKEFVSPGFVEWLGHDSSSINVPVTTTSLINETKTIEELSEVEKIMYENASDYFELLDTNQAQKIWGFELPSDASLETIVDYYYRLTNAQNDLMEAGFGETEEYKELDKVIRGLSNSIETYENAIVDLEKTSYGKIPKTIEEYLSMREDILNSESVENLPFYSKSHIADILDKEYGQSFNLTTAEAQAKKFVGLIDGYDGGTVTEVETFLNMRTAVNDNNCTVGQYISQIDKLATMTDGWSDEEKKEFNTFFGLDTDSIKKQYDELQDYLSTKNIAVLDKYKHSPQFTLEKDNIKDYEIKSFLDNLSAHELQAAINLKTKLDWENDSWEDILSEIEKEAELIEAISFDINIENAKAKLESLNTAITESVSGTGLATESINSIQSIFMGLDSYDPSKLFERTANGMRLNTTELNKLNSEYKKSNIDGLNGKMNALSEKYLQTKEELAGLTYGTEEYSAKVSDLSGIKSQINATEQLITQYEGLTSAYQEWQTAESTGNQRDMYENVLSGFETVEDELSRGWLDDSSIEFLQLLKGDKATIIDGNGNAREIDIATASVVDFKKVWDDLDDTIENTSYSVKDFFTTDEEGKSTSLGVYNFLDAVGQLEKFDGKNVIERDADENIIGFNFDLVGGDEAIAEALGVSEELVQIMVRAADDAGFVVSMDGTYQQLDVLKEKAAEAARTLKETFKATEYTFFQDSSEEGILKDYQEAVGIWETFKQNKNSDGTINMNVDGAEEAYTLVSTLQSMVDQLSEPVYMKINASEVEKEMQVPLSKLQEYETLVQTEHQLQLKGTDTSAIETNKEEILNYFEELKNNSPKIATELGIEGLTKEEIEAKIEAGEIKIPATIDLQVEMNNTLRDLINITLYNSGLLGDKNDKGKVELEKRVDISLYAEEIDTSDVDEKTEEKLRNTGDISTRRTNIEIIANTFGVEEVGDLSSKLEGLDDTTVQAVANVVGQVNVDTLKDALANLSVRDKLAIQVVATAIGNGDVETLRNSIDMLSPKTVQAVVEAFGLSGVEELKNAIGSMDGKTVQAIAQALGITDVNSLQNAIDNMHGKKVNAEVNTSGQADKVYTLQSVINSLRGKTVDVVTNIKQKFTTTYETIKSTLTDGGSGANGTANINGTIGKAFVRGDWRTKKTETALTGELGREIVVTPNNQWYTVGDTGAEFATIPKGSIIFNHKQSEELFKYGKVISNGGRAKALAGGTAFSKGTGGGFWTNPSTGKTYTPPASSTSPSTNTSTESLKETTQAAEEATQAAEEATEAAEEAAEEFEDTIDWIEIAISRVERIIDRLGTKVSSVYRAWSERNSALSDQISEVRNEINLQQSAYNEYMNAASGVGLSEDYASKIRDGTINIETIKDEALKEKIDDYQKWYEKALSCQDAILELQETESSLYAQRFENIQTQYDGIIQGYEHTEAMLNEYISQAEEQGYIISKKYYDALIDNEKSNIDELKREQIDLIAERDKAVDEGKIIKGSEAWLEQCSAIDEVTQVIEQGETSLLSYAKAIEEINWQVFDLVQERISDIVAESEFLVELMSNKDLFDDKGGFTEQGVATIGLHGLNYNTLMYQADDYGKEVTELDKQIAQDPYDQELINRRKELLELQRESILAAEEEKNAIKDLVEESISLELDALQEKIDKTNEAIDSQKDLYDYQKRVASITEEISDLEKQRLAYSGDDSEEAKQKLQQIFVELEASHQELEETEYDKYVTDQQILLDNLFLEYETILNSRLDNIDYLLQQVIDGINMAAGVDGTLTTSLGTEGAITIALRNNTATIGETLKTEVGNVGTKLSNAMNSIWLNEGSGKAVLDLYGKDFQNKHTTTNEALNSIKTDVKAMVDDVDKDAQKKITTNKTSTSAKKDPTKDSTPPTPAPAPAPTPNNNSSGDGVPKIGDKVKFISGIYYYDSYGTTPSGSMYQGSEVYITNINTKGSRPYHISTGSKLGSGDLGWLKLDQLTGYVSGKKNFANNEWAWTQEKGEEYIIRPSDGAILTPIARSDSVLNATASGNIWRMANNPTEFIKNNLRLDNTNVPNNANIQSNLTQHFDNITFNMPNVKNYTELISEMQRDPKFEKLILAMTLDQVAGKSSLAKGKAIR